MEQYRKLQYAEMAELVAKILIILLISDYVAKQASIV